jgi:hypothetical protein
MHSSVLTQYQPDLMCSSYRVSSPAYNKTSLQNVPTCPQSVYQQSVIQIAFILGLPAIERATLSLHSD